MLTLLPRVSDVPMIFTWVTFFLVATGIGASSLEGQQHGEATLAEATFIVSGTLVREDRTPIHGAKVMIAEAMPRHPEAKDTGYAIMIGEGGVMQNPSDITDANGKFSITVRRSLFKKCQEFVVVVPFFGRMAVAAVKIDQRTTEYKLGKITRRANPVIR